MNTTPLRRAAAATAVLVAGVAGVATAGTPAADAAPSSTPARAAVAVAVAKTTITFEVPGCDGCDLQLMQARWDKKAQYGIKYWHSSEKTVEDGSVSWRVPSKHTQGLSMTVVAPWEGHTGYVTTVAFRYGGEKPGDEVGFREARSKSRASACWAGTDADEVTIPLTVRKVWVEGVRHRVRGSIAYAAVTQDWMAPMRQVWDGVMGSQDVNICGKRNG
ncbi:MAG TPA: hypothetical protein VFT70_06200 [Nocardioides sp.]|nr:hypothetical protein [Nocardioides sp.]